jgi:hypothetical protein
MNDDSTEMATESPIIILGMHRSGTSFLAGSVQSAGLVLGAVHTRNPHNARGNREHPEVMAMHEAVLEANDCSWHQPPATYPLRWPDALREKRRSFARHFPDDNPWGFKDPRALLLLEGWLDDWPNAQLAGIFRHPAAVAASISKRVAGRIPLTQGLRLWHHYNQRLLSFWHRRKFPLIEFSGDQERLLADLQTVCEALQLPATARSTEFFDRNLRHHEPDTSTLPDDVQALYDELRESSKRWRQSAESLPS